MLTSLVQAEAYANMTSQYYMVQSETFALRVIPCSFSRWFRTEAAVSE